MKRVILFGCAAAALVLFTPVCLAAASRGVPARFAANRSDPAAQQQALVVRQEALLMLAQAQSAVARNPSPAANQLVSRAQQYLSQGNLALGVNSYAAASNDYNLAIGSLQQIFPAVGGTTAPPVDLSQAQSLAAFRLQQESADRRRLRQAEELLYRVRTAASQSNSYLLHQSFDRMQDNLSKVQVAFNTAPELSFSNDLALKLPDEVRPLLDETIQEGQSALAIYDAERRVDRDLEQTRGRIRRAKEQLGETPSTQVRDLMTRADELVRDSQQAGAQGDFVQARVLLNNAERTLVRALELDRQGRPAEAPARPRTVTADAKRGLDKVRLYLRVAAGRLGNTSDPVTARLLLVAESDYDRARASYRKGDSSECLRLLKLVGRLLAECYEREGRGT